ncbi:TonB-dependent receptor [Dyadobacter chenwenxiniae]|uniref:TonB-dependent receptor n=1 Tax=Dyadobacter chenwenxiniae TaxID=2906456 RepID=A0A9X1TG75_9BACT|nr:TonB-dependent receptor [Dyadobacter chenwenxiniae]MCF0063792.1 TonB-dependent receptor [Dyadobacter chenwenxiniae]UON83468.1 TonB-dependent receptor [Dyadobacter chenwenxiniae]
MKTKSRVKTQVITVFLSMVSVLSFAQTAGSFKGKILDQSTKQPIVGATIQIDQTQLGTNTDTTGLFAINHIPAGTYAVNISCVGFQTKHISEIVITSGKTYYTEIEVLEEIASLNEATVKAFKGENNPLTPVSAFSLSREEIFRNPGAQGDIMRALASLPGVVSSGAQYSAIAARGQGTQDNVYMVDDIPMFNLSHMEAEGFSSGFNDPNGGRFSIFAPRIIDNVQFQNGGFDAVYGRKSSSYLGLGIKEGNKETWSFVGQFDLLGGTVFADGPISKKTSVFASARYQNFGLLQRVLSMENPTSVGFGDYLVKTTTQINAKNKLSLIAMYNPETPRRGIEDVGSGYNINDDNSLGTILFDHRSTKTLVGLNLRTLIDSKSYIKNVLYFRSSTVDNTFGNFTPSLDEEGVILDPRFGRYEDDLRRIKNNQAEIGYRSIYTKRFDKLTVTAGIDAMAINLDHERNITRTDTVYTFRSTDPRPGPGQYYQILDPSLYNSTFEKTAFNGSGYIAASWKVANGFTLNPSIRYDYTGFTEQHTISPRLSGSVLLGDKQSINFSSGIYYQDAAYSDVAGQSGGNTLKNDRTFQNIIGYKYQFSGDLKLVVEGWHKQFDDLIVQPNRVQSYLNNNGTGYAYGGDVSVIKRLSQKWYGQVSYSYMQSKRDDNNGLGEYDYTFNIPHNFSLLGSFKPNEKWIFSGKFRYSTGRPIYAYIVHENVLNDPSKIRYSQEITAINGRRLADYVSLDIRVDYNVPMRKGMFSAFVDLANINNQFNVNAEIFLPQTGKVFNSGLGVFPTFGVRVEL